MLVVPAFAYTWETCPQCSLRGKCIKLHSFINVCYSKTYYREI